MLKVPIEHLMHMPQHILLQKLAELAKQQDREADSSASSDPEPEVPPQ